MPSIGKTKKLLKKTFEGLVEASVEGGCVVLNGEVERWDQVLKAGIIAATENRKLSIVNNVTCTVDKPLPVRKPRVKDTVLDDADPDVLIIGAGIIGCAVARELSRCNLKILVVDKEHDVAAHATGHSNGLVHSGAKYRNKSKKYLYTTDGSQMMPEVCRELGVAYKNCGQYFIYNIPNALLWMMQPIMFILRLYWWIRGLRGAVIVYGEELRALNPGVSAKVNAALYFPTGGAVSPQFLAIAYAENSVHNGVKYSFDTMVESMEVENGSVRAVVTNRGTIRPRAVVNAAGVFCEEIAAMADDKFYSVRPVKGTTVVVDNKQMDSKLSSIVSSPVTGGRNKRSGDNISSVMRNVHGKMTAGPCHVETINKEDFTIDKYSTGLVISQAEMIVPAISAEQTVTFNSGITAATYEGDFIVSAGRKVPNVIHAAGIQFPGMTAAPAIAKDIAKMIIEVLGGPGAVRLNPEFNPEREAPPVLREMDITARESLIAENPNYGITVCHCEQVTRGEILEALRRELSCDSIEGLRLRVRACSGVCQGQCCTPHILELISSEKGISLQDVRENGKGSEVVYGNTFLVVPEKPQKTYFAPLQKRAEHESDMMLMDKLKHINASELNSPSVQRSKEAE